MFLNGSLLDTVKHAYERRRKLRAGTQWLNSAEFDDTTVIAALKESCLTHVRPINQPLILISQPGRSGGTLLSQLFDGHPQCFAYPFELKLNRVAKAHWPESEQFHADPDRVFTLLVSETMHKLSREGYKKGAKNEQRVRFLYVASIHREIFLREFSATRDVNARRALDTYFSGFFNAWLDYGDWQNANAKKWITGFWPWLAADTDSIHRFFSDYPDGLLLSVYRDPVDWYASAVRHPGISRGFSSAEQAANMWLLQNRAILANRRNFPDRTRLISFARLVADTPSVMNELREYLGIDDFPTLTTPTFNGFPIASNSSFEGIAGVDTRVLERTKHVPVDDVKIIRSLTDGHLAELEQSADF